MNIYSPDTIWNPHLTGLLLHWWQDKKYSASRISIEFGLLGYRITKNAVIGKIYRLKLPPRCKIRPNTASTQLRKIITARKDRQQAQPRPAIHRYVKEVKVPLTKPDGRKNVLLVDHRDGMCRAIVGYVDGQASKAVYCGQPVVCRTTLGSSKLVMLSYCAYHKSRYLTEVRGKHERDQSVNGKLQVGTG